MAKFSTSKAVTAILILTTIIAIVEGQRMPIRMLFQHIQERRRLGYENDAQQVGSQSQAQSNALTNSISVAGIPITNTVSGSRASSTSGSRSGSLNEQFNLGGLGFNAGVDSQKIGTGIGINRTPGHLGFHLGALNVDLSNNGGLLGKNQNTQTQTAATSMATGEGATSTSTSNTYSRGFDLGHLFGIQNTFSRSQAKSTSLNGQTSATAAANAAQQNANTFQPYYQYEQQPAQGLPYSQAPVAKRETDVSDDPPRQILTNRQRRSPRQSHHHHGAPSQPLQGGYNPYGGKTFGQPPVGFPQFQQQNANGNAVAQNQNPFFNQNAGANTHTSNFQNPYGQFQNNGGSSISSNLANNGQSGQLSAANTDQQSYLTGQGFGNKNNAQSQSANFNPFGLQATNSNAGTQYTFGPNGEREQAFGSANANEQNKFGTSNSGAQTNSEKFNENGVQGEKSSSSSFSNVVNNGGGNGNFGTNVGSNSGVGNGGAGASAGGGGFNYGGFGGFGRRRRAADDSVVFPKNEESEQNTPKAQGAQGTQQNVVGVVNATNSNQNSTQPEDVDSRFGLLGALLGGGGGGARGPGPLQQIVGGLINGVGGGGQYYPQPGGYYPQQGGYYPPQGYYPQQGGYYPQPGFGPYPQRGFGAYPGGFVGRG